MRCPSAASLLTVWEQGLSEPLPARSLRLLEAACPGESAAELARLPIGDRDGRLLALRESAFGPRLESVVSCPACGEALELSTGVSDLRPPRADASPAEPAVRHDGYRIRFRLPTSEDLAAVADCADEAGGRRLLLDRCLVAAERGTEPISPDDLPEETVAALAEAMESADPQARVELDLACPECGHRWQSPLHVAWYVWTEVDAWARRILGEVHALASAYGWSEAEILNLSAWRRQVYLELMGR